MERDHRIIPGSRDCTLLLSFLLFFTFSLLYVFRTFDNNTLTSWQWTVGTVGIGKFLLLLAVGLFPALALSRARFLDTHPVCVLVMASILAVLPLWREPELLVDSGRYFLQAKSLSVHGISFFAANWGGRITSWTDLPLVPFLYGLLFAWFGESRTVIQFFNTLVFVLTVLVTFRTGAMLWNRRTGFHAGLLLLGIPYLLVLVPQMLVDIHAMFLVILALSCYLEAVRAGGVWRISLAAVAVVLAGAAKFSTWPILLLLPFCGFVSLPGRPALSVRRSMAVCLAAVLLALPLLTVLYPVLRQQIALLLSYQRPALRLWHEDLVSTFLFQVHPFITLLAAAGVCLALRSRDRRFLVPLLLVLLIPLLQIQRSRYSLPFFPLVALMAARGLDCIRDATGQRYAVLLVVSSGLVLSWGTFLPFFSTTSMVNLQQAGAFIDTLAADRVAVRTLPQARSEGSTVIAIAQLDLFTGKEISAPRQWAPAGRALPRLSPLLATWKLNRPSWYQVEAPALPLVIISGTPVGAEDHTVNRGGPSPDGVRHFALSSGVFRFRTFVSVYY